MSHRRLSSLVSVPRVLTLLVLVSGLSAQVAEHQLRFGVPQDWTHRHVVFNRRVFLEHPELASIEPRVLHQFLRQMQPSSLPGTASSVFDEAPDGTDGGTKRDWGMAFHGGRVAFGMSPAKYVFDPSTPPSCTNDYAVFGLNVAGVTGGQGNLVAFNNLYRGTPAGLCGTGFPSVLFSYNTTTVAGGKVLTSPVLSLDGTKIAFVESATGASVFHVLTWATGPGNGTATNVSAVPGSMISITYDSTASDSISSPWIDYGSDAAYVGADDGLLYKITGVFKGTPALAGAPWPITIGAGGIGKTLRLTGPVLDRITNNIFVGDNRGFLWSINATTPATVKSLAVGKYGKLNPSILDSPLVDSIDGTVFAVASNDGTSAVLVQANTTALTELARSRIGQGSVGGTAISLYDGAFDNNYFTSPSTGSIFVCGTGAADATPWGYFFTFSGTTMNTTPSASSFQILNSTTSRCSPISEFFNPNVAGGTDFFFWGMTQDCTAAGVAGGCVVSMTTPGVLTTVNEPGGTSAVITDNFSTAGQASSIYFSSISTRNAIKLTQNGLN